MDNFYKLWFQLALQFWRKSQKCKSQIDRWVDIIRTDVRCTTNNGQLGGLKTISVYLYYFAISFPWRKAFPSIKQTWFFFIQGWLKAIILGVLPLWFRRKSWKCKKFNDKIEGLMQNNVQSEKITNELSAQVR
jgi:hypothetical protein